MMHKVTKAIIPAAGYGTRMLPITKAIPKEMLPVGNKPVIHHVVEEAVQAGIRDILIVISRGKEAIVNYFDRDPELEARLAAGGKHDRLEELQAITNMANIHFIRQSEMKGLGDAVLCGRSFVGNDAFALLLGDTIIRSEPAVMSELVRAFSEHGRSCVAIEPVAIERASRYGVCGGHQIGPCDYVLESVVEKPPIDWIPVMRSSEGEANGQPFVFAARYLFKPRLFDFLSCQQSGYGGEIQLTDSMAQLMAEDGLMGIELQGKRLDVGSPECFSID